MVNLIFYQSIIEPLSYLFIEYIFLSKQYFEWLNKKMNIYFEPIFDKLGESEFYPSFST